MIKKYIVKFILTACCLLASVSSFGCTQNNQKDHVINEGTGGSAPNSDADIDADGHEFYSDSDNVPDQENKNQ